MIRLIICTLIAGLLLPFAGFAQTPMVTPDVFSSLGVKQSNSQVSVQGSIGQLLIGPIGNTTAAVNQGYWPQIRQLGRLTSGTGESPAVEVPAEFRLGQNFPNPFNPATTIPFSLARQGKSELKIFNTLGQTVRAFDLSAYGPGSYALDWNGTNGSGLPVPSGLYFYRLTTSDESAVARMLLLK
jgi:hypothetical protein